MKMHFSLNEEMANHYYSPGHIHVITFAGALRQSLLRVFERRTLPLRWRLAAAAGL